MRPPSFITSEKKYLAQLLRGAAAETDDGEARVVELCPTMPARRCSGCSTAPAEHRIRGTSRGGRRSECSRLVCSTCSPGQQRLLEAHRRQRAAPPSSLPWGSGGGPSRSSGLARAGPVHLFALRIGL